MRARWPALNFVVIVAICSAGLASGPSSQVVSPPDDRVVRVLVDRELGGGVGFFEGTGSVIGNTNVSGQGFLWILTADHVVSSNAAIHGTLSNGIGIAFGNSPDDSGHSTYYASTTASVGNIFRGGPTGNEDIAIFGIHYGAFDSSKNALRVNLASTSSTPDFTEIGFGDEGALAADGYNAQFTYGTQRFFNQQVTDYSGGIHPGGYTYNAARFSIVDPNDSEAIALSGVALDADSGSPLFMSSFNGSIYTDSQFAILTALIRAGGNSDVPFGSTELALALSDADLAWINSSIGVPEPAIISLLMGFALLLQRRRV